MPRAVPVIAAAVLPLLSAAQAVDSTRSHTLTLKSSCAGSYATSRNWQAPDAGHCTLNGSFFLQHTAERRGHRHQHQVMADLGYLKFIDSTWSKGTDRLACNLLWSRSSQRWTRSWSAVLLTQFLPNEALVPGANGEDPHLLHYGGPMAPGTVELGYGATWYPWTGSSVQFAVATVRFVGTPTRALQDTTARHLFATANTVLDLQYGTSVVVSIDHPFTERISWTSSSRGFCNGLDRDHVSFDALNRVAIKVWKYVQVRLDTHLGYDPLVNYRLRFAQEILLGVFYEKQRTK